MSRSLTNRNGAFQPSELLNGIVPNVEKLAPRLLFFFAPDFSHRANEEAGDELKDKFALLEAKPCRQGYPLKFVRLAYAPDRC